MKRFIAVSMIVFLMLVMGALAVGAEEKYPTRPISFIVPSKPGGMCDTTARLFADKMKKIVGQPIVIVDRPGASGVVGVKDFLGRKPDGYTLLYTWSGPFMSIFLQEGKSFDMDRFKYVGRWGPQPRILFAQVDAPYKTFEEFIAYVKEHPGKVTLGGRRMTFEIMKSIGVVHGGLDIKYVLFKSGGEVSAAVLGRHVEVAETGAGTAAYKAAEAGKLRPLINLGTGSVPPWPELRNVREKGYPFALTTEYGLMLHAEVPEYIRQKWEDVLKEVTEDPELLNKLKGLGFAPEFLPGTDWEVICKVAAKSVPALAEFNKLLE